jgi:hypothetical protein
MSIDFKDLLKFGGLAAATYATGGLLAPVLGSMGLGATAAGIGGNAIAGGLVGKIANPNMTRDQMIGNMIGGAVMGAGLQGLGSTMGQFGATPGTGLTVPNPMVSTPAVSSALESGAAAVPTSNFSLAPAPGPGVGVGEGIRLGATQAGTITPVLPGSVAQPLPATNPMAGLQRGMDAPGAFAHHMATAGRNSLVKTGLGAAMMDYGIAPNAPASSASVGGEYTIHDVYGSPLSGGDGSSEATYVKARKVRFADGGNVATYASGGRLVDPKKTAPKGVDTVPATIDGVQPARLNSGEYVMTKKAVKNVGGPAQMDKLHARLKRGGIGKYA